MTEFGRDIGGTQELGEDGLAGMVRRLPPSPGCYLFKDWQGQVIYIGKAVNLRSRVRSYFQNSDSKDQKTRNLVGEVRDVEFVATESEYEAFLLESNLVHERQPRYNVFLKDDKSFPFIRVTTHERFPRVHVTRRPSSAEGQFYGPFLSDGVARRLVDMVRRLFGVRGCRREIGGDAPRPFCLDYHIRRCAGPCAAALCDESRYARAVGDAALFLSGDHQGLARRYEAEMKKASDELRFEDAAVLRDRVAAIKSLRGRQSVTCAGEDEGDVFGWDQSSGKLAVVVLHVRGGRLSDRRQYHWEGLEPWDPGTFFREFIPQFYADVPGAPARVCIDADVKEAHFLERWLSEKRGGKVAVSRPVRGRWRRLCDMAGRTARLAFVSRFGEALSEARALEELAGLLKMGHLPSRIEGFDISTGQGRHTVASMVAAVDGKMAPSLYRRYSIRGVGGTSDDLASMREVVRRRFTRLRDGGGQFPDLVLVDGGAGQVGAAMEALAWLGVSPLPALCGLAKKEEEVHLPGEPVPVRLPRHSPALRLLQRVRDEAHRFAIAYQRNRSRKGAAASQLDGVPGIGPARRKLLLKRFGSPAGILAATVQEMQSELGEKTGGRVHSVLHQCPASARRTTPSSGTPTSPPQ